MSERARDPARPEHRLARSVRRSSCTRTPPRSRRRARAPGARAPAARPPPPAGFQAVLMPAPAAMIPSPGPAFPIPDLLSKEPMVRIDLADLRETLVFAFAMGGSVEAFDRAVAGAALPESGWDRANFARDLFLDQLLEGALSVRVGGRAYEVSRPYLLRALGEPPRD